MTKSEIIQRLRKQFPHLFANEIKDAVETVFNEISDALIRGDRVEIRGFGSFSTRKYKARKARNPRTGESVDLGERHTIYYRPGKKLKEKLNS